MRTTRSMTFDKGTSSLSGWLPTAISKDMLPMNANDLREAILKHLEFSMGKDLAHASVYDMRMALTLAIRDRVVEPWFRATRATYAAQSKRVYYLSMEFLIGRLLEDAIMNIGLTEAAREAVQGLGHDFRTVLDDEPDAALGNGGLGRLAACFLDSMSTLGCPAYGYGIRYEHGLFRQSFGPDGRQVETAEDWLRQSHGWEFERPEAAFRIGFGGAVAENGRSAVWTNLGKPACARRRLRICNTSPVGHASGRTSWRASAPSWSSSRDSKAPASQPSSALATVARSIGRANPRASKVGVATKQLPASSAAPLMRTGMVGRQPPPASGTTQPWSPSASNEEPVSAWSPLATSAVHEPIGPPTVLKPELMIRPPASKQSDRVTTPATEASLASSRELPRSAPASK